MEKVSGNHEHMATIVFEIKLDLNPGIFEHVIHISAKSLTDISNIDFLNQSPGTVVDLYGNSKSASLEIISFETIQSFLEVPRGNIFNMFPITREVIEMSNFYFLVLLFYRAFRQEGSICSTCCFRIFSTLLIQTSKRNNSPNNFFPSLAKGVYIS